MRCRRYARYLTERSHLSRSTRHAFIAAGWTAKQRAGAILNISELSGLRDVACVLLHRRREPALRRLNSAGAMDGSCFLFNAPYGVVTDVDARCRTTI